jgi:CRP/FNR family transcriptional regulator
MLGQISHHATPAADCHIVDLLSSLALGTLAPQLINLGDEMTTSMDSCQIGLRANHLTLCARPIDAPSLGMQDLLRMMGVHPDDISPHVATLPLLLKRLEAGAVLIQEGAPADSIYVIRVGSFKTFHMSTNGQEQVLPFASRADVLGFDGVCMGHYPTGAVALEDSSVYVIPIQQLFNADPAMAALNRVMYLAASKQLALRGELASLRATVRAEVRLARFLLQQSRRMGAIGQSRHELHLRMTRRDIASYLGVAHETISRAFGSLHDWRLIQVHHRDVTLLDLEQLATFAADVPAAEPMERRVAFDTL